MKKTTLLALSLLLAGFTAVNAAVGFYVSGSNLKDANGNNFVIRGINNPHIWFDSDAYNALTNIAAKKVNTVRIVWQVNGSPSRLDQIIKRCIDLKMIPMVELHDATGSDDANRLRDMANYFARADVKSVIKKYERYILVNIANEWGGSNKSEWDWKEQYKNPITILRNAGIVTTIVIDAPGWGQNSNGPLWHGQELLNYDPKHNLLFSVHMYGSWNDAQKIRDQLGNFKWNNMPLIIGEFGYNYNNGNNNLGCKVDHKVLMQECQSKGYGYLAWSWKGNDASNAWLDLTSNWNSLNWWGNEVFYNTNGINNTAKRASVFGSGRIGDDTDEELSAIEVGPNPVSDVLNISIPGLDNNTASVSITSLQGTEVYRGIHTGSNVNISLKNQVAAGMYIVTIQTGNKIETKKIIVL